jgi:hypothetical protein
MKPMNAALALGLVSALFAAPVQAQTVEFGLKGGLNLATGGDSDAGVDAERGARVVAGGFLAFALTPRLWLQPELLYSSRGIEWAGGFGPHSFKQDYLEVPVLARFDIPIEGSALRPSLFAGPALAFEVRCTTRETTCSDFGLETKSPDTRLVLGGGLGLERNGMRFGLEVRYTLGTASFEEYLDVKHRVLGIMATIAFGG